MSILIIVGSYFVGSIPFAWMVARWWGTVDLRRVGSGNLGAANVFRVSGIAAGLLVAVLDIAKGAASVLLAERLVGGGPVPAAAGLASIVGHVYPVWFAFRGGKGVSTACGVFAVLTPMALLPALAVFVVGVWITKYVSAGSLIAAAVLPPTAYVLGYPIAAVGAALAASILILYCHRSNLWRLWMGTERVFAFGRR